MKGHISIMKSYICQYMTVAIATVIITVLPKSSEAGQNDTNRGNVPSSTAGVDEGRGQLKWLIVGMIAAQVADIASTSIALHRGCVETTYYGLQNRWAIGGMKAGGTVALTVTLPLFHNKKPKLTKTLAWAEIGSGALGAVVNATRLPHCR